MSQKIDETLTQLQQGITELFDSEKYKEYLDVMSKFHDYSVNNCLLISMQRPDATYVAGYTAWKEKFKRQVMKGEHGITIISPAPIKKKKDVEIKDAEGNPVLDQNGNPITETKEYTQQSFRIAKVFDISQTEGEPLPELVSELTDPVEGFSDYLDAIKAISPVPIRFDGIVGSANGYYSPQKQEIVIRRGMPEEQTLKTMLHECAHARLGHGGDTDHTDRQTKEVQAESVAYCCCRALGLDASNYSFGYIAGWSSGKEQKELKESLQVIREQADLMIKGIEKEMKLVMELRQEKLIPLPVIEASKIKISM